jgi:hypothetical protein
MMNRFRLAVTLMLAAATLAALTSAVQAARVRPGADRPVTSLPSVLDQGPTFTRVQTITVIGSAQITATVLRTNWDSYWEGFSSTIRVFLPADYSRPIIGGSTYHIFNNTAPITTTFGEVFTNSIDISPTAAVTAFLSYSTNSRAVREGNLYHIVIHTNSPDTSTYQITLIFPSPYQYDSFGKGIYDTVPEDAPQQAPGRVWWGPLLLPPTPGDRFDRDVYLRLPTLYLPLIVKNH